MTILHLSTSFHRCPKSWQNFIISLKEKYSEDGDISVDIIDKELRPYRAQYFEKVSHTLFVMFEEEKYLTAFALRWS